MGARHLAEAGAFHPVLAVDKRSGEHTNRVRADMKVIDKGNVQVDLVATPVTVAPLGLLVGERLRHLCAAGRDGRLVERRRTRHGQPRLHRHPAGRLDQRGHRHPRPVLGVREGHPRPPPSPGRGSGSTPRTTRPISPSCPSLTTTAPPTARTGRPERRSSPTRACGRSTRRPRPCGTPTVTVCASPRSMRAGACEQASPARRPPRGRSTSSRPMSAGHAPGGGDRGPVRSACSW